MKGPSVRAGMVIVFLAVTLSGAFPAAGATPWEEYLERPSPDRAARVQARAYSTEAQDDEQEEWDLMLLEVQVLTRDRAAVRLAFRLRKVSDGHVAEMLDIMLGRLIRIDAPLFLRELQRAGPVKRLDSLVGNCGPEYVDRLAARSYEISRRIDALGAVADPQLENLRGRCIKTLRE